MTNVNGRPMMDYVDLPAPMNYVRCRLDMNFVRPGKFEPPAISAGRAPDRVGVMFLDPWVPLHAGHRVVAIKGPVTGTFDLKNNPDMTVAFSKAHHQEVEIIETSQDTSNYPDTANN